MLAEHLQRRRLRCSAFQLLLILGNTTMRTIYLNLFLPAILVVVGFAAAWMQGRQVDRMDRQRHGENDTSKSHQPSGMA